MAIVVESILSKGIYNDGASNMDSVKLTNKAFKSLKNGIEVTSKNALISSADSHAFEAGQYTSTYSMYIAPAAAKNAGLKEEDYFVVIASGSNGEAEEPINDQILLYNSKRELVEKRLLSPCPESESSNEE